MCDRPDLDEAMNILQAGGFNITGGKYAPKSNPLDPQQDIEGELGASEKPTPQEEVGGKQVVTRVLNLYAGIGGNRKLWDNVDVTAVELEVPILDVYSKLYPYDTHSWGDAHQYLLDHFQEFDLIWSSPPCPTHSRVSTALTGYGIYRYPDMKLYEEIIFLQKFCKTKWVVENVIPYYEPLIKPTVTIDRHHFWSNFDIPEFELKRSYKGAVTEQTKETLAQEYGIELPADTKNQRKLLRNAVRPEVGLHILSASRKVTT